MFVVDDLEKYLDPEYVDELSSVGAKTDAVIAGKLYSLHFIDDTKTI